LKSNKNYQDKNYLGVANEKTNLSLWFNESQKGFEGKIVDETRETISIEIESGEVKKLIKANINFMDLSTREIIKGRIIAKRPEERLKK